MKLEKVKIKRELLEVLNSQLAEYPYKEVRGVWSFPEHPENIDVCEVPYEELAGAHNLIGRQPYLDVMVIMNAIRHSVAVAEEAAKQPTVEDEIANTVKGMSTDVDDMYKGLDAQIPK